MIPQIGPAGPPLQYYDRRSAAVVATIKRSDCPDNQGNHQGKGCVANHQGKGSLIELAFLQFDFLVEHWTRNTEHGGHMTRDTGHHGDIHGLKPCKFRGFSMGLYFVDTGIHF